MHIEQANQPDMRGFSVIVAACKQTHGIGVAGQLPWSLRGDMQFFKQLTRSTQDPLKRNAVVMGRKTWQSIPERFRPLDDRLNVVLSRNADAKKAYDIPDKVVLADSLEGALGQLNAACELGSTVETVYVIGGSTLYADAIGRPELCQRVYLTSVSRLKEAEGAAAGAEGAELVACEVGFSDCDAFFPNLDTANFRLVKSSGPKRQPAKGDKGAMQYEFLEYTAAAASSSVPSSPGRPNPTGVHEEMQYLDLVRDVLDTGVQRGDRTGTGTISKFGVQMRFDLRERFPLLTTKSTFWRGVAEELLWFMSGDTSAATLQEKGIKIWDGNSSREYLDSIGLTERAEGDLGPVYGWQWRHFGAEYKDRTTDYTGQGVDQLAEVIHKIKNKPNDRRIILSAWNPADLGKMALPPCHMFCQFFVANGELSCQMYQRSADLGLGVPFNIASYALLTCLLAHTCGLKRGDFVHCIGDAHVYLNHVDALREQLQREPRPFPTLTIAPEVTDALQCTFADLKIDGYTPHGKIAMKMAV